MKHKDYKVVVGRVHDDQSTHAFSKEVLGLLNAGYYCIGGPSIDQFGLIVQALGKLADSQAEEDGG
jgi:hypothetical protein